MEGVKIEKHGITLSLPWEGNTMCLSLPLDEVIRLIGSGIGECDAWRLMHMLKLAKEHNAELEQIFTRKRLFVVLNFRTSEELNEFREALNK